VRRQEIESAFLVRRSLRVLWIIACRSLAHACVVTLPQAKRRKTNLPHTCLSTCATPVLHTFAHSDVFDEVLESAIGSMARAGISHIKPCALGEEIELI
jgi:hypothetical protein